MRYTIDTDYIWRPGANTHSPVAVPLEDVVQEHSLVQVDPASGNFVLVFAGLTANVILWTYNLSQVLRVL